MARLRTLMATNIGADKDFEMRRNAAIEAFAKLKGTCDRKRREEGKCERRKSHEEKRPGAVALAKRLHRTSPKTGKRMSLRKNWRSPR